MTEDQKVIRRYYKEGIVDVSTDKVVVPDGYPDKIIMKESGQIEFRRTFFYKFGKTTEDFASRIIDDLDKIGYKANVMLGQEVYKSWPAESYWQVIVEVLRMHPIFLS